MKKHKTIAIVEVKTWGPDDYHHTVEVQVDDTVLGEVKDGEKVLVTIERIPKDIVLKLVPRDRAIVVIKDYVKHHQGCKTSDVIFDLELNPSLVLSVLQELEKSGDVRGEDIAE